MAGNQTLVFHQALQGVEGDHCDLNISTKYHVLSLGTSVQVVALVFRCLPFFTRAKNMDSCLSISKIETPRGYPRGILPRDQKHRWHC